MSSLVRACLPLAFLLLSAGCSNERIRNRETIQEETLRTYAQVIRWGDIEQAEAFIDPALREKLALSELERERYRQVRITGYDAGAAQPVGTNELQQSVRIDLVNIHTQVARSIVDHQTWRYDEQAKRWWLVSGLPDISRREP